LPAVIIRESLHLPERQLPRDAPPELIVLERGGLTVRICLRVSIADLVVAVPRDEIDAVHVFICHRSEMPEDIVTVLGPDPRLIDTRAAIALRVVLGGLVGRVRIGHANAMVQFVVAVRDRVLVRVGDRDLVAEVVVRERRGLVESIRDTDPTTCIVVAVRGGMAQLVDALLHPSDFVVLGDSLAGVCIGGRRQPPPVVVAERSGPSSAVGGGLATAVLVVGRGGGCLVRVRGALQPALVVVRVFGLAAELIEGRLRLAYLVVLGTGEGLVRTGDLGALAVAVILVRRDQCLMYRVD